MRSLQHYRTWQHQINFILLSSSNTVHRFISILLKRLQNPFKNKDSRFCVLWNVTAVSYAGTDKKNDAWKHRVSTVSLSVSGDNGPIAARYANYELSFRLMSDKRLCHSEAVHQRGMNVTAFGSNSSHAGGVVVIQRDRHENPTARLRAFLKEGFRLLYIVFYPFSPVCVAPAFLYISWPLSRHHSCLIGRAGGSSSGSPPSARVQRSARREDDNTASSVSRVNICCCCVQDSLSVALLQPQSTPTPALATRIISSGRKSFPLVSYYSFLHRLMMSQSIHKFVVVCRFEKFDMAAGCTGMKVLSGQTAKTWQQGRGDISQREEAN